MQQPRWPRPSADATWYTLAPGEVAAELGVDPARGLSTAEAQQRLQEYGPNALAAAKQEPVWKRFFKHYPDYMQIVLVVAALVSLLIEEYGTAIGLALLTLFNAWLGYHQEGKAEAAAASLGQMMKSMAKVRRDGVMAEIPAEQIVPGDIVVVDAGDRVPADGRIILAATLQIEEGALTGESVAVEKDTASIGRHDVGIGDRLNMAFMNTNVTRGHGEILVTTTGMGSEVGHIAHMLSGQKEEKTPLTKQVDRLTIFIIIAALFAFVAIVVMGLAQGDSFAVLFGIGVALAVGSIPDALPAVVTTILSVGSVNMAKKNAIMKVLPAVETLGSTSAINSDKTGTLTLNQMTVREIVTVQHHYTVSGEGYSFDGQVQRTTGDAERDLDYVMFPCALCNDSDIQDGEVIGDPTEAALYVLAQKGGVDVTEFRRNNPRVASVPFDSDYKFMATFHRMPGADGKPVIRAYVKGAPDVVLNRSSSGADAGRPRRAAHRGDAGEGARRERAHRQPGPAGARPGAARVRPGDVRALRRPDGADAGPGDFGADRRGRPAARRGGGRHRQGEARRHPGPDDHRRPRRHRGRDRRRAGHRGPRGHRAPSSRR